MTITIRNAISAWVAFCEIWLPQDPLTELTLTWLCGTLSSFASEARTALDWSCFSSLVCTCQLAAEPVPTCCTIASETPPSVAAFWTWLSVTDAGAPLTPKTAPPLNSTLNESPRTSTAMRLTRMMRAEMEYHIRRLPTKSTDTSPRYSRPPIEPRRDIYASPVVRVERLAPVLDVVRRTDDRHGVRAPSRAGSSPDHLPPLPKNFDRAASVISGLVNRITTTTSMIVVSPSVYAKPFTSLIAK